MAVKLRRGRFDTATKQIKSILESYSAEHPHADIQLYRQNFASIRIRIIDPDFKGVDRAKRHDDVWEWLEPLSDEVVSQISVLLLLTPEETATSMANVDFENPVTSRL